jgi:hypothetical protein
MNVPMALRGQNPFFPRINRAVLKQFCFIAYGDDIVTESQFTFQRDAMMKETHTDPSTGKTETETRHLTTTVVQDEEFRYSDAVASTIDTKWGTKNVLVIKSVVTNAYGSIIDVTDYRDTIHSFATRQT